MIFLNFFLQRVPRPMDLSPSQAWKKLLLKRRKKVVRMSGSKWVPEIRLPSLAKLTLSVHPLLISLAGTLGMLTDRCDDAFQKHFM